MVYFVNQANTETGRVFGFDSESQINSKSVVLPNGPYKVYAYGWDSGSPFQGNVRCGYGDGGSDVNLSGAAKTVTLTFNKANCSFGSGSAFGIALESNDPTNDNFDTMSVQLCTGAAYPSCSSSSSGTWYVKTELLGGIKPPDGTFVEGSGFNITSGCSSGGSPSNIATNFRMPIGGNFFSPPMRIKIYDNAGCTGTASGTYQFAGGIKQYQSVSSGSSYYLTLASSSTYYNLQLNQYF
jgi:hypothetical protein